MNILPGSYIYNLDVFLLFIGKGHPFCRRAKSHLIHSEARICFPDEICLVPVFPIEVEISGFEVTNSETAGWQVDSVAAIEMRKSPPPKRSLRNKSMSRL